MPQTLPVAAAQPMPSDQMGGESGDMSARREDDEEGQMSRGPPQSINNNNNV
jgi:hypothetical protein